MKRYLLLLVCTVVVAIPSWANTYTVTKTVDDKFSATTSGTLRWAITQANSNPGYDVINFSIATTGNTFETSGANSWALISLYAALPTITETVLIDGTTQFDTNLGFVVGQLVGVDGYQQGNINYPDVYIVCGYSLPSAENAITGNGLFVNAANVTIKGLAISGFGNTNTTQASAVGHGDISIAYSTTPRTCNTLITECFLSCDPRGAVPSTTARRSKSGSILILGNNNYGTIQRNYIAHPGGYGIVFHGTVDNSNTTPNLTPSRGWLVTENQLYDIGTSTTYSSSARAADAISMMAVRSTTVRYNYINNWEQFAIDMGHNADSNRVENNTITGFLKTTGSAPCGGVRAAFSSQRDTVLKNQIFNNTTTTHLAGIWTDQSQTTFTGGTTNNDSLHLFLQNEIHDNINSGIVLSTNGTGSCKKMTISQNSIYNNTGLGIDLNFSGLTGATAVTVNDDGDVDAGVNDLQNFPVIDSAKISLSTVTVWGKGPAGSTMEFFIRDGQINSHGGRVLNYGEGKRYIGSGVEGSASDLAAGVGSYNTDGNVATNNASFFQFVLPYVGFFNTDSLTATATLNGNTSEFGPKAFLMIVLDQQLLKFNGSRASGKTNLAWEAVTDRTFDHFVVEYSTDGKTFFTAGTVYPDQLTQTDYRFTHFYNNTNTLYYRLKTVNSNSSFKFSNIITVSDGVITGTIRLKAIENPFQNQLSILVENTKAEEATVRLVNTSGAVVASKSMLIQQGSNSVYFRELAGLKPGLYQVVLTTKEQRLSLPVIKH